MKPTLNEKFLAYLALLSGISLSIVAEYYSILGLMAIFSAAPISVVVMGIALGVGKITATLWLKQNWKIAPWSIRGYLLSAISVLMLITSMGIFGFLSKAHSDQSLVSGDVLSKIALYDEKIKTAKENIDANRKALKQYDEALDAVLSRSTSEAGADKAVSIRRSQQKERARLQSEIQTEQKTIGRLSEERAPIAAEVRKVEAEVGPIKYIAAFVYGETDETILEKAVTWVIIILIIVFDPLAVILLLSSQISFQNFRERKIEQEPFYFGPTEYIPDPEEDALYAAYVGEKPTAEEKAEIEEGDSPRGTKDVVDPKPPTVTESQDPHPPGWMFSDPIARNTEKEMTLLEKHPYLNQPFPGFKDLQPLVYKPEPEAKQGFTADEAKAALIAVGILNDDGSLKQKEIPKEDHLEGYLDEPLFVQNEEQKSSGLWSSTLISKEEYLQTSATASTDLYNDAPSPDVAEYITMVKSGRLSLKDIPEEYMLAVKARI